MARRRRRTTQRTLALLFNYFFIKSQSDRWPASKTHLAGDIVKDAIQMLYDENVAGAPIADVLGPEATIGRASDRYIGFIDFASMFLWSLENWEKAGSPTEGRDGSGEETSMSSLLPMLEQNCEEAGSPTEEGDGSGEETGRNSLLSMLEQNPQIGQTKLGELAKSFLLEPFLPVHLDDTLFHVLLMLAKHRLHVVPVMERPDYHIYTDESLEEALQIMPKSQIGAIAVINRATRRLIGCFRRNDVHLLMEDDLFQNRKNITMEKFICIVGFLPYH